MCGLVGILDHRSTRPIDRGALLRMNEAQWHRGPDDGGIHIEPGIGLAHRRLSIIDRAGGSQPMRTPDERLAVVFNGEIYNHHELARELAAAGHKIATKSDTEVILHSYREWGEGCVTRFRGMFAFALWDAGAQTLFLARDRLGVKPLFYAPLQDGTLIFGSELKSLLAHGQMPRSLDPLAVEEYFALGYVADPRCIFGAARKLAPGHTLTVVRGEKFQAPKPYWDVRFEPNHRLTEATARIELAERLSEAVAVRMESEVPLGAFLSGGVDSSAVVASMSAVSGARPITCSIGFAESAFDETPYAKMVADQYNTHHYVEQVGVHDTELIGTLAEHFDEPFADSSALPTYRVCELARKHVTVALSGDGADESFGGYRRYRFHVMEEKMRRLLPQSLRSPVFGTLAAMYPKADGWPRFLRAKTTFQALARDSVAAYFHSVSLMRDDMRSAIFSRALKDELSGYSALEVFRHHAANAGKIDALSMVQYLDMKTYLPGDINTKVDRTSMAHALEVREPMMDHPMVEWAATLPAHFRLRGQVSKWLLKKSLEPVLPHEVMYRPKMGFAIPVAAWLRGPLRSQVVESVLGPRLLETGWFEPRALSKMVDEHMRGVRDHSAPIWSLLMFELFLRRVVDSSSEPMRVQHAA